MASVVFIIRIPYEKDTKSLKTVTKSEPESLVGDEKEVISQQIDNGDQENQIVNEVKFREEDHSTDQVQQNNDPGNQSAADDDDVENLTRMDIAEVLQNELRSLNVQGHSWTVTKDEQFQQVLFLEKTGERVENILARLTHVGIGNRPKTSVSIIPTSVHIQPPKNENIEKRISACKSTHFPTETSESEPLLDEKESMKDQFIKSIKSRLTVEQVVEGVRAHAVLTFDFVMFTVLASLIAAVGLVEDNAVVLVASMLVSPLMGPILGVTFGTVINKKSLRNTGLKTEICGLVLSVVVGFVFGFLRGPFNLHGATWDSKKGIWPTTEMTSRGMIRGLWVGVAIALPSGAGVALSVLGGNAGSLVGVAISASLLVPAVNSGVLWAFAIISAIKSPDVMNNSASNSSMLECPPFKGNSYVPTYSCNMGTEASIMAIISLAVTILNIICIVVTAMIVLKIKEVARGASSSNATQTFWTRDIKIARESYKTLSGKEATNFLKEWKKVRGLDVKGSQDSIKENEELLDIIEEVEKTEDYQSVVRRAPRGEQNLHTCSKAIKRMVPREDDIARNHEKKNLQRLKNLQTYYTHHAKKERRRPHVGTIFNNKPEVKKQETKEPKVKDPEAKSKKIKVFYVVDTENRHHTSVVTLHDSKH